MKTKSIKNIHLFIKNANRNKIVKTLSILVVNALSYVNCSSTFSSYLNDDKDAEILKLKPRFIKSLFYNSYRK